MRPSISRALASTRVATLVGTFERSPAYAGLETSLRRLIGEGRIPLEAKLPSERDLAHALDVSRTTVTRAYELLQESGYAEARRGAGTFTRVPGGVRRATDRALLPYAGEGDAIDLSCAATSAPPGIAAAYAAAADELTAHLGGHGYFPAGLPQLQEAVASTYAARGLPTRPEQVLVTLGALSGTAIVAQALTGAGDRVMVEDPVYPNATMAIRRPGARIVPVPVDPEGWDLDVVDATLRSARPRAAYLVPDFQNPTGHLMSDEQRAAYARSLRATRTVAVVDEAHQALPLDGQEMPAPFAVHHDDTITVGSASKTFWGGLRLGWVRAQESQLARITRARVALDLGAPVLEQLVLTRLLTDGAGGSDVLDAHRARLRAQRDRLVTAVADALPDWRFHVPTGGLALWCELPPATATAVVAEAERRGVILAPGPLFSADGGLGRFVRIPWTLPPETLEEAVRRLAVAWSSVGSGETPRPRAFVA